MQLTLPVVVACVATLHVKGYTVSQISESALDALIDEDADLFALADVTAVGLERAAAGIRPAAKPAAAAPDNSYTLAQLSEANLDALMEEDADLFALADATAAGLQRSAGKVSPAAREPSSDTQTCSAARGRAGCTADTSAGSSLQAEEVIAASQAALRRISEARAIRKLEADTFAAEQKESDKVIGSLDRVMLVLTQDQQDKLKRKDVAAVQDIVHTHAGMIAFDRAKVLSFFPTALLGSWKQDDAAKVVDVLGSLREAHITDRSAAIANDERAKKEFDDLVAKNEIEASQLLEMIKEIQ